MSRRRRGPSRPVLTLLAMGILVGAASIADAGLSPAAPDAPGPIPQPPAAAGSWYCPGAGIDTGTAVVTVAAVGQEAASVTAVRHRADAAIADEPIIVSPGEQADILLEGPDAATGVSLQWHGGPTVATWRIEGVPATRAPCHTGPSDVWTLTGFDTAGESRSTLRLFNPFGEDAVASVSFGTEDGLERMVISETVSVPAGGVIALDLNEFQPERSHLAALVEVRAGRLIAHGERSPQPLAAGELPHGLVSLTAAGALSLEWSFAFAPGAGGQSSWLSVFNPGERDAEVEVQVSDPLPDGSVLLEELSVPAGAVARIDLDGASGSPQFGVSLEVLNDAPVVVTRFASLDSGSVGASLGAVAPSQIWALTGGAASSVSLYNPGGEPVTARIDSAGAPAEWSQIRLAANERRSFNLPDAGPGGRTPALITADTPIIAEMHAGPGEVGSAMWMLEGIAEGTWTGPDFRPRVRRDPALATQPRDWSAEISETEPGPGDSPTPDATGSPEPAGTPSPTTTPGASP